MFVISYKPFLGTGEEGEFRERKTSAGIVTDELLLERGRERKKKKRGAHTLKHTLRNRNSQAHNTMILMHPTFEWEKQTCTLFLFLTMSLPLRLNWACILRLRN